MSSFRNILQRCASRNSILGSTPLQIQCTFNPVYSAYPTSISRQAYSSDANEAPKNGIDPVRKYILEMMNAKKSEQNVAEDQKPSKAPTFNKSDSMKSWPNVKDQKTSKWPNIKMTKSFKAAPIINKNLNLRKYYIAIHGLSKQTTHESLREFYSQFGEIVSGKIIFPGEPKQFGNVAFTSRMDRALNSLPHCIDGKETKDVYPAKLGRKQLTLQVVDLSPKTTTESLRKFYSRFGMLSDCWTKQGTTVEMGQVGEVTFAYQEDMHRALDAQPHVIDGSEVFLKYSTFDLDLKIENVPECITEEDLNAFYSKYGQLRECRLFKGKTGIPHAYVSYSAIDEINRAMDDCPHVINGKPMKLVLLNRSYSHPVSLLVGSLPENVTEEALRKEFSEYGKPVYWILKNDGDFNQSGPYGIVKYATEQEALNVLNSGPHTIEGSVVDVRKAKEASKSLSKKEKYVAEYQKPSKAPTFNKTDSMKSWPNIKSWPNVTEDQKTSKAPVFNKTDFRPRTHQLLNTNRELKFRPTVTKDQNAPKASTFNKTDSMNSRPNIKSWPSVSEDQKTSKALTFNKTDSMNSRPNIAEDQKASKAPTFNKNLNLRKYYISILDLSKETTLESLREFYSQFGEIAVCNIIFPGEPKQFGSIAFTSREAMDRALNTSPHYIDGKKIKNVRPAVLGKKQLTLNVVYLSPKTTFESLREFYTRFGRLNNCWLKQGTTAEVGQLGEVTFAYEKDMHRALDAQPHVIDGSEVFLKYATFDLDFKIEDVPECITEEDLNAFYSKYGQLRDCCVLKGKTGIPHAYVSFSAIDGINRAMDDCPHVINGKPMKLMLLNRSHSHPVSLVVGSLPENVTEETLRKEFSKHGKPVYWALVNDGDFNQSGPYGLVKYATEQEAIKVLNSGPHTIKGSVVDLRIAKEASKSLSKKEKYVAEDQKVSKAPTFNKTDSMNSRPNIKYRPSVTKDQNAPKAPTFDKIDSMNYRPNIDEDQRSAKTLTFNKNLNLRKYYIRVDGFSINTTPESLREFYSQFGEIAYCNIIFPGEPRQFGSLAFTSRIAMDRALNSLPHCIDGKETNKVQPASLGTGKEARLQLTLHVQNLSPKTTTESLKAFYSRFGWLKECRTRQETFGQIAEVTFAYEKDMHRALDAQPHIIDGSEVFLKYATNDLDLQIDEIPEFITEEELIEFYSKYGQLRRCLLLKGRYRIPEAFVSFSAIDEVNRAMDDRPHIIGGKPLKIKFISNKHLTSFSLFVGSLPENVTEETLRKEFSKYGKPVFWKLENDGHFNQSGPYGIVKYATEQEVLKVLNSGPHTIEGAVVDVRKPKDVRK
ncbi:RNA recognition motif domain-containing protein [Ditylenchus destructor]|nr:RNA recognition motif domain-containing protein [Ditylenchus destructor]